MKRYRTIINVVTFLIAAFGLVFFGANELFIQQATGPKLTGLFTDASGVAPRNDVTMRGVVVGTVEKVELEDDDVRVEMRLERGTEVPEGTKALIVRRSPIGELTIELEPGDGPPLEPNSTLAVSDTLPPPDVSRTIEALADVLHAVPSEDLNTVVSEVAAAVDGRSDDLARFSEASAALPERLLEIKDQLKELIETGPKLTGTLADNAQVLGDDITQTYLLVDILKERRYDLVDLYANGADFAQVAGSLISEEKANIACFVRDSGVLNAAIAAQRSRLAAALDKNHFFFDALEQSVQKDPRGYTWFRVQLLPHTEPAANSYTPHRAVPDVFPGRGCKSRYGPGVGPAQQDKVYLAPKSKIRK